MGKCISTSQNSMNNDTESNKLLVNENLTNTAIQEQKYDKEDTISAKSAKPAKNKSIFTPKKIRTSISKSKSVSQAQMSLIRPLTADSTIDISFQSMEDTRSKRDIYQLRLEGINICKPWYLPLNDNCTMNQVETIINYHLGLDMNTIQYDGEHQTNDSYKITVGSNNQIDLNNKTFTINSKTKFINYWNDIYNVISNTNSNPLQINNDELTNTLHIGNVNIQFQRTLRIPSSDYKNDNYEYMMPHVSLGCFPLKNIKHFTDVNIKSVKYDSNKYNIYILPMHSQEALWMLFNTKCDAKSAVKVGYNGMNIITGKEFKAQYLNRKMQNYIVVPKQQWIDGVNDGDGIIKQIVVDTNINEINNKDDVINIDELCNCIEVEVFNKLNDNVYVSFEDKLIKERDYYLNKNTNNLLFLTPEQSALNRGDLIYFHSTSIPTKHNISINDARCLSDSGEILFFHSQRNNVKYKNITNDYINWIRRGAMLGNNNYVIANCNDGEEFRVIPVQKGVNSQISPVQWRITELMTGKNVKIKSYQTLKEQNIELTSVLKGKCDKMEIFIKYNNLNSSFAMNDKSKIMSLIVKKSTSIKTLKSLIEDDKNIPSDIIQLIYNNKILEENDKNLKFYHIINGSTIYMEIHKRKSVLFTKTNQMTNVFLKRQQDGVIKNGKINQVIHQDVDVFDSIGIDMVDDDNDSITSYYEIETELKREQYEKDEKDEKEEEEENELKLSIKYNTDCCSKVIIFLCDVNVWKMITKQKELPTTTINKSVYEIYNYPYLKTYETKNTVGLDLHE